MSLIIGDGVIVEKNVTNQGDTPITEALNHQDSRINKTLLMNDDDDQLVGQQMEDVVIDFAAGSVKYQSLLMLQGE